MRKLSKAATLLAASGLVLCSFQAAPEDIDIFTPPPEESNVNRPNVLFILDNSSNWSREAQHWPDETQGQAEASAIYEVLDEIPENSVNVGVMEYITGGAAADQDSGYIRHHIRPVNTTNRPVLQEKLKVIHGNINDPTEKRARGNPFGNLMWDVHQYLAGGVTSGCTPNDPGCDTAVPAALADNDAYSETYTTFASPLTENDACTRTIIVFIGNNTIDGPSGDSEENKAKLRALALAAADGDTEMADNAVTQIPFADYVVTTSTESTNFGYSSCFASQADCTAVANSVAECADKGFASCSCSATAPQSCGSTYKWTVKSTHTTPSGFATESDDTVKDGSSTYTGQSTYCQVPEPKACTPPTGVNSTIYEATPDAEHRTTIETSWVAGSCVWKDMGSSTDCKAPKVDWVPYAVKQTRTLVEKVTYTTTTQTRGTTDLCYATQAECDVNDGPWDDVASTKCSAFNGGCECTATASTCSASNRYQVTGSYNVTKATQLDTFSAAPSGTATTYMLDEWARFLRQSGVTVPGVLVNGAPLKAQVTTYTIDVFKDQQDAQFSALLYNAARVGGGKYFRANDKNALLNALRQILTEVQAVNSAFSSASLPVNATNRAQNENQVFIGVFKPDKTKDPGWFGNMKRYQLIQSGSTIDLGDSLGKPAINTQTGFLGDCAVSFWTKDSGDYWFSATSDDPDALSICSTPPPGSTSNYSDMPDGPFVEKGAVAEVLRRGNTLGSPDADGNYEVRRSVYTAVYSDTSDDAAVGDLYPIAADNAVDGASDKETDNFDDGKAATNDEVLVRFIRGEDVFDEDLDAKDPVLFPDALGQKEPRSTIHGDVVHSRPQPINYGDADDDDNATGVDEADIGVVVFYGANDGHYRAVQAKTGRELWSFVAPESFGKFERLAGNSGRGDPIILYFKQPTDELAGAKAKDYFFDGSTGVYQTDINDPDPKTWIFPTLRRGGNRLYALDVTDPLVPTLMWSAGCDSTHCPPEYANMGQTWALPNVAFIRGYCGIEADNTPVPCPNDDPDTAANEFLAAHKPLIVLAGGYDTCEDANTWTPNCSGAKGRGVYVIDAETGVRVRYFDFSGSTNARSVVADVALIDAVGDDDMVDYGYAVDAGGNIYRMDFVYDAINDPLDPNDVPGNPIGSTPADPDTLTPADMTTDPSAWLAGRVAYTNDLGHKFLFPPALVQITATKIYLAIGTGDREHPLRGHYPYDERDGDKPTETDDDDFDLVAGNNGSDDPGITNRFYVFKDDLTDINAGTATNLNSPCPTGVDAEGKPIPPTAGCMRNYTENTTCGADTLLPNDAEAGWFLSLPGTGEQVVTSAVVAAGFVFFSTNAPDIDQSDACTTDLGEARGYFLSLLNGSGAIGVSGACGGARSSVFVGGGLPPSPVLATVPIKTDTNGDGVIDDKDASELRTVVIGAVQKTGEPSSPIQSQRVRPPIESHRKPIYWYKSTGDY